MPESNHIYAQAARAIANHLRDLLAWQSWGDAAAEAKVRESALLLDALAARLQPFKPGDRVRIARKVERDSLGRNCYWTSSMDAYVGSEGYVLDSGCDPSNVMIDTGGDYVYAIEALDLLPTEG